MKISIVICSYNRDQYILDALESLKRQKIDASLFEIVIVNNNSTDTTEEKAQNFISENPDLNIKYVVEKQQGLSFARNKGIEISSFPLIVYIDDDAIAEPDFVQNLLNAFANYPEFMAIGGKVIPIYPNNIEPIWMSKYIQRLVSKVDDGDNFMVFRKKYPVGCNMAFRKEIFKIIGRFNTDLTLRSDDKYIFSKLKKAKMKTIYAPNVIVHHNIEGFRLEKSFIKKLSRLNGHTERVRLKSEPLYKSIFKFFDFLIKIGIAVIISIGFILKGHFSKAQYLIMVMYFSLIGFLYFNE